MRSRRRISIRWRNWPPSSDASSKRRLAQLQRRFRLAASVNNLQPRKVDPFTYCERLLAFPPARRTPVLPALVNFADHRCLAPRDEEKVSKLLRTIRCRVCDTGLSGADWRQKIEHASSLTRLWAGC